MMCDDSESIGVELGGVLRRKFSVLVFDDVPSSDEGSPAVASDDPLCSDESSQSSYSMTLPS
jgi:hypothetical protein